MTPTSYQVAALNTPESEHLLIADDVNDPNSSCGIGKTIAAMFLAERVLSRGGDVVWVCENVPQLILRMDAYQSAFLIGSLGGYKRNIAHSVFYFAAHLGYFKFVDNSSALVGTNAHLVIVDESMVRAVQTNAPTCRAQRYVIDGGSTSLGNTGVWTRLGPDRSTISANSGGPALSVQANTTLGRSGPGFVDEPTPDTVRSTPKCTCGTQSVGGLCSSWCDLSRPLA